MKNNTDLKWMILHSRSQKRNIILSSAGRAILAFINIISALLTKYIIDAATGKNYDSVIRFAVIIVALVVFQRALMFALDYLSEHIRTKLGNEMRSGFLHQLMIREFAAVQKTHSGEWMNRMFSDVKITADGMSTILPGFVSMVSQLIFSFGALFYLAPLFAVCLLATGIAMIACVTVIRKRVRVYHRDAQEKAGTVRAVFQETVENLLIVKVFQRENIKIAEADKAQEEYYHAHMKRRKIALEANSIFNLVFQLGYALALCLGALQIFNGKTTFGTLTATLQVINQIKTPVAGISGLLPRIYTAAASAERLRSIENEADEFLSEEPAGQFESISFKNVSFSYGRDVILDHTGFEIRHGDIAALTGGSGGGKSTIFLLMLGIYQPDLGDIIITTDQNTYKPGRKTRAVFSYVPQGNALFSGTIRENVCFGRNSDDEQKIWDALNAAEAEEFVRALPHQLDEIIGERGSGLSEGQRQRIAIARAIFSQAPVLLLDEATSALDSDTEAAVLKNISKMTDRTCIIVTHRAAALNICTKHLSIKDGHAYPVK